MDPAGGGGKVVAEHVRSLHKGTEDLVLDHYLEVLNRKPGALAGSTALVAARATGAFTPVHQRFWDQARAHLGDGAGTRALIGVLLLHRTMSPAALTAGMARAAAAGVFDPDLVAVEARLSATPAPLASPVPLPACAAPQAGIHRPTPRLADYDQLLRPLPVPTTAEVTA